MGINVDGFLALFKEGMGHPFVWAAVLIIGIIGVFVYMVIQQLKMEGRI